jgi:flagellar biogenesis protein FliO
MEWLSNLTNGENGAAINLVLITLALAFLLIVIVWIFKKITGTAARRAMRSRVPRLSITDSTTVDEKRYLVMVRRDNVEHLLLIGGANDLVVESNIVRMQASQKPAANSQAGVKQAEAIEQSVPETESSSPTPIAGAAAFGAAGIAAVTSATSSAASTASEMTTDMASKVSETASNATEVVTEKAGDVVEAIGDTASNVTSSITETTSDVVEDVAEVVSPNVEVTETPVETVEEVEIAEMDLESTISAKLDDALSSESLDVNLDAQPLDVDNAVNDPQTGTDDEMQRLLDELSGEVKEPAQ